MYLFLEKVSPQQQRRIQTGKRDHLATQLGRSVELFLVSLTNPACCPEPKYISTIWCWNYYHNWQWRVLNLNLNLRPVPNRRVNFYLVVNITTMCFESNECTLFVFVSLLTYLVYYIVCAKLLWAAFNGSKYRDLHNSLMRLFSLLNHM